MREWPVRLPPAGPLPSDAAITSCAAACGLLVTMRSTLAKYPGCTHWHLKRGADPGTLEVTLWPDRHRLWISAHGGRRGDADWIEPAARELKQELEAV